jgi:sigma-B regulation protein RsbU (phosphoserine phosphatase)
MHELDHQVELIAHLQRRLLPRKVPQPPCYSIAAHHTAGVWPGGDYYDFLSLADEQLVFLIGDASDEAAPAAVPMALVRATVHSCPLHSGTERLPFCPLRGEVIQPPHIMLGNLNRILVENTLEEQSMTLFCGVLQPAEGVVHYANAGHPPPYLWRSATRSIEVVRDPTGLPLGLDGRVSYHHRHLQMQPGDILLCYTDGLTTALNDTGATFGALRVGEGLVTLAPHGAKAVRIGLVERLEEFLQGSHPQDDVSLVVLERTV